MWPVKTRDIDRLTPAAIYYHPDLVLAGTRAETVNATIRRRVESNSVQFEVEMLKDGKIHEVIVDGRTGKVLNVSPG